MSNEELSDVIKNLSGMLNSSNIPDNVKEIIGNLGASSDTSDASNFSNNSNSTIDMDTMLKIGQIVSKMNSSQNDARSNLLLSLKPYLRESRREKLEQYVKLLNMSKVLEVFNNNGSDEGKVKWGVWSSKC